MNEMIEQNNKKVFLCSIGYFMTNQKDDWPTSKTGSLDPQFAESERKRLTELNKFLRDLHNKWLVCNQHYALVPAVDHKAAVKDYLWSGKFMFMEGVLDESIEDDVHFFKNDFCKIAVQELNADALLKMHINGSSGYAIGVSFGSLGR